MNWDWFYYLVAGWAGVAVITCIVLIAFNIRSPYGRHTTEGWGKMISNKWGWFFMELPALLIMPILAYAGPNKADLTSMILVGLWVFHYVFRTLIFPFRLRTKNKKMPITIVVSAIFFNGVNGFLNGYFIGFHPDFESFIALNKGVEPNHLWHFTIGICMFFLGMIINRKSDKTLIGLRSSSKEYQIPRGGLFNIISCPNHLGEIIEWTGFAILAMNPAAVSFAIWTFCNLAPRSLNHHSWYKEKFSNYPKKRKALIPYVL